jgi:hypothetical protein
VKFRIAVSLVAACLVPVETTWAISASAQQEAPPLPSLPPPASASPASAPLPPAPAPSAPHETVRIHMVTNATAVQFLFRAATPASAAQVDAAGDMRQYSASCIAPCDLDLAPGDYFVALSRSGGKVHEQEMPVSLRTATTLDGAYESHAAARVAGIVLLSTIVPIGALLALAGTSDTSSTCSFGGNTDSCVQDHNNGLIAAGLVTLGVGTVLGIAFVLQRDGAAVQVVPQAAGRLVLPGTRERAPDSNGLALRVTF